MPLSMQGKHILRESLKVLTVKQYGIYRKCLYYVVLLIIRNFGRDGKLVSLIKYFQNTDIKNLKGKDPFNLSERARRIVISSLLNLLLLSVTALATDRYEVLLLH